MTPEEAHKWLSGEYDEDTYFKREYVNKVSFRSAELPGQLAVGVAAKMKQAICVLQYEELRQRDTNTIPDLPSQQGNS